MHWNAVYNWGLSTTASLCSTLKWKSKSWSSPLITTISGPCTATTWDQLIQRRHALLHSSPMFIQATALRTIILHCQGIWGNWVLQGQTATCSCCSSGGHDGHGDVCWLSHIFLRNLGAGGRFWRLLRIVGCQMDVDQTWVPMNLQNSSIFSTALTPAAPCWWRFIRFMAHCAFPPEDWGIPTMGET